MKTNAAKRNKIDIVAITPVLFLLVLVIFYSVSTIIFSPLQT